MGHELVQVSRAAAWICKDENRLLYFNQPVPEENYFIDGPKK
jgi:hypothetical protein